MADGPSLTPGYDVYTAHTKERQKQERMVEYLGDLIKPVTGGYDHVNLDMAFTNLSLFDLPIVENLSLLITWCHMNNLKRSEYMARGQLAVLLVSRRSYNAKSMDMFTTMVTKQSQEFEDTTKESRGFGGLFGFAKNKQKSS